MKYLLLIILVSGCYPFYQNQINPDEVKKIQIENHTQNQYKLEEISCTDRVLIEKMVYEMNNIKLISSYVDVKNNFGSFDIKIETKDRSKMSFSLLNTANDGVIIEVFDELGFIDPEYYKNDNLEKLVLSLFQSEGNSSD